MKRLICLLPALVVISSFILTACNADRENDALNVNMISPTMQAAATEAPASRTSNIETKGVDYNTLTIDDKAAIIAYMQSRYEYYDEKDGKYTGDTYTETIMQEAASRYGLTTDQIHSIWTNLNAQDLYLSGNYTSSINDRIQY